jgi:glycosyltransferase involved in cell wall biosynthesis
MAAFPTWEWQLISLPPRYFNWRIRGNALYLSNLINQQCDAPWDVIIATSMTDLAGLRSLCPQLARTPALLYFHENQFAYPANDVQARRLEPQMMTLFSALSADRLVFNSAYNRDSFLQGVGALMAKMPDAVPAMLSDSLASKAQVLPVPLLASAFGPKTTKANRPTLLWNHRWEHDKAPERLYQGLCRLGNRVPDLQVHVVGQQFRQVPGVFSELQQLLARKGWQGAWGYQADRDSYNTLLAQSHCVISTALHDFQGLSVLEAVAAGAMPVVPRRLAYPEWFADGDHFYASAEACPEREAEALATAIVITLGNAQRKDAAVLDVTPLSWSALKPAYRDTLLALAG